MNVVARRARHLAECNASEGSRRRATVTKACHSSPSEGSSLSR